MKKTWIMGLAAAAALLSSCMGSSNAAMAVGGELTGSRSTAFNEPAPFGMVLVPRGSLKLGEEETDSLWGSNAPYKEISVESFWMDDTEITNAEYRQFVHWVRDSIISPTLPMVVTRLIKSRRTNMANPLPPISTGRSPFLGARRPKTSSSPSRAYAGAILIPAHSNSTPVR